MKTIQPINRFAAFFVALTFLVTNHCTLPFSYAALPGTDANAAGVSAFPGDLNKLEVPSNIGKLMEVSQGRTKTPVLLLQDAHAIPDAQKNICNLIDFFQQTYGLKNVAVEGVATKLNPQIFKSFPDQELLRKTFTEYLKQGEMTGTTLAAVFNKLEGNFVGVEDWALYEEGYGYFLTAMTASETLKDRLFEMESALEIEKETRYSPELKEADRALTRFRKNYSDLMEVIRVLGKFQRPEEGSELAALLAASEKDGKEFVPAEMEVKQIAQQVKHYFETQLPPEASRRKLQQFNEKEQAFRLSQLTPQEFAVALRELTAGEGFKVRISESLKMLMKQHMTMRDIEGTRFFDDFQQYAARVKEGLYRSDEERVLDIRTHALELAWALADLELTRDAWAELKALLSERPEGAREITDFIGSMETHLAFYDNAEMRDRALTDRVLELVGRNPEQPVMLVAGGFHTEGVIRRFKEAGVSYALLMPEISALPSQILYKEHMRGNVSWQNYFEVENGKINLYKAFVRALRDKLIETSSEEPGRVLKNWRDQIIRDLADQNRLVEAPQYTRFMDEVADKDRTELREGDLLARVDRFIEGLRMLESQGRLTEQNIMNLLVSPSTIPAGPTTNVIVPGGEMRAHLVGRPAEQPIDISGDLQDLVRFFNRLNDETVTINDLGGLRVLFNDYGRPIDRFDITVEIASLMRGILKNDASLLGASIQKAIDEGQPKKVVKSLMEAGLNDSEILTAVTDMEDEELRNLADILSGPARAELRDLGERVGARLHGQWRTDFVAQWGEAKQNWQKTRDEAYDAGVKEWRTDFVEDSRPGREANIVRVSLDGRTGMNAEGVVFVDIAHMDFEELPKGPAAENLAGGIDGAAALEAALRSGVSLEALQAAVGEAMAEFAAERTLSAAWAGEDAARIAVLEAGDLIHNSWLSRNGSWASEEQKVAFGRLDAGNQKLDINILQLALEETMRAELRDLGERVGARLHGQWRTDFVAQWGEAKQNWQKTRDEAYDAGVKEWRTDFVEDSRPGREANIVRVSLDGRTGMNAEGVVFVDIAHMDFEELPKGPAAENLAGGIDGAAALEAALRSGVSLEALQAAVGEAMAEFAAERTLSAAWAGEDAARIAVLEAGDLIHNSWLSRNGSWASEEQKVAFGRLDAGNQKLDINILQLALEETMRAEQREVEGINIIMGDITQEAADAVVAGVSAEMSVGVGLTGAIIRAVGARDEAFPAEVSEEEPYEIGRAIAKDVKASSTPANWQYVISAVIHAWDRENPTPTEEEVRLATRNALLEADNLGDVASVTLPAFGTGILGVRADQSAEWMISTAREVMQSGQLKNVQRVTFVLRDEGTYSVFEQESLWQAGSIESKEVIIEGRFKANIINRDGAQVLVMDDNNYYGDLRNFHLAMREGMARFGVSSVEGVFNGATVAINDSNESYGEFEARYDAELKRRAEEWRASPEGQAAEAAEEARRLAEQENRAALKAKHSDFYAQTRQAMEANGERWDDYVETWIEKLQGGVRGLLAENPDLGSVRDSERLVGNVEFLIGTETEMGRLEIVSLDARRAISEALLSDLDIFLQKMKDQGEPYSQMRDAMERHGEKWDDYVAGWIEKIKGTVSSVFDENPELESVRDSETVMSNAQFLTGRPGRLEFEEGHGVINEALLNDLDMYLSGLRVQEAERAKRQEELRERAARQVNDVLLLLQGGARYWDEEHTLLLITPAQLAGLPEGIVLKAISDDYVEVGVDEIDGDTRGGLLAFGFEIGARAEQRSLNARYAVEIEDWFKNLTFQTDQIPDIKAAFPKALLSIDENFPDVAAALKFSAVEAYLYLVTFRDNGAVWAGEHFSTVIKNMKAAGKLYEGPVGLWEFHSDVRRGLMRENYLQKLAVRLGRAVETNDVREKIAEVIDRVDRNGSAVSTVTLFIELESTLTSAQGHLAELVDGLWEFTVTNDTYGNYEVGTPIQRSVPAKLIEALVQIGGISLRPEVEERRFFRAMDQVLGLGRDLGGKPSSQISEDEVRQFIDGTNQLIDGNFENPEQLKVTLGIPGQLSGTQEFYPVVLTLQALSSAFPRAEQRVLPEIWQMENGNGLNFIKSAVRRGDSYFFRMNDRTEEFPLGTDEQAARNFVYSVNAWSLHVSDNPSDYLERVMESVTERTAHGMKLYQFGEELQGFEPLIMKRIQRDDFPFGSHMAYVAALRALRHLFDNETELQSVMGILDNFVLNQLRGREYPEVFWDSAIPALSSVIETIEDLRVYGQRAIREDKWRMGGNNLAFEIKTEKGEVQSVKIPSQMTRGELLEKFGELIPGLEGIGAEIGQEIVWQAPRVYPGIVEVDRIIDMGMVRGQLTRLEVSPWSTNDYYARLVVQLDQTYVGHFANRDNGKSSSHEFDIHFNPVTERWEVAGNGYASYRVNAGAQTFGEKVSLDLIKPYIQGEVLQHVLPRLNASERELYDQLESIQDEEALGEWAVQMANVLENRLAKQEDTAGSLAGYAVRHLRDVSEGVTFQVLPRAELREEDLETQIEILVNHLKDWVPVGKVGAFDNELNALMGEDAGAGRISGAIGRFLAGLSDAEKRALPDSVIGMFGNLLVAPIMPQEGSSSRGCTPLFPIDISGRGVDEYFDFLMAQMRTAPRITHSFRVERNLSSEEPLSLREFLDFFEELLDGGEWGLREENVPDLINLLTQFQGLVVERVMVEHVENGQWIDDTVKPLSLEASQPEKVQFAMSLAEALFDLDGIVESFETEENLETVNSFQGPLLRRAMTAQNKIGTELKKLIGEFQATKTTQNVDLNHALLSRAGEQNPEFETFLQDIVNEVVRPELRDVPNVANQVVEVLAGEDERIEVTNLAESVRVAVQSIGLEEFTDMLMVLAEARVSAQAMAGAEMPLVSDTAVRAWVRLMIQAITALGPNENYALGISLHEHDSPGFMEDLADVLSSLNENLENVVIEGKITTDLQQPLQGAGIRIEQVSSLARYSGRILAQEFLGVVMKEGRMGLGNDLLVGIGVTSKDGLSDPMLEMAETALQVVLGLLVAKFGNAPEVKGELLKQMFTQDLWKQIPDDLIQYDEQNNIMISRSVLKNLLLRQEFREALERSA